MLDDSPEGRDTIRLASHMDMALEESGLTEDLVKGGTPGPVSRGLRLGLAAWSSLSS